ncbi:MAG TPA: hypothetical protein VFR09_07100 [Alphaproteobacteria bacterium]|nr:hypothetical protein [Alphaproteobacteria bacterium]
MTTQLSNAQLARECVGGNMLVISRDDKPEMGIGNFGSGPALSQANGITNGMQAGPASGPG